tara:strand:- start:52 stop:270 length:219 start_codon:yes stop_codon:yes gene_type:complete
MGKSQRSDRRAATKKRKARTPKTREKVLEELVREYVESDPERDPFHDSLDDYDEGEDIDNALRRASGGRRFE